MQATKTDKIKKPRSDDKGSGGEESKQRRKGSKEEVGHGDFAVDLELMSALLKKMSVKTKAAKKKAHKKKQEDSLEETTRRKKKAMFVHEPDKAGEEKDKEEVAFCFKCVVGFVICIDRGNNAKGGFNKKISEGLAFLREYLDKAACILSSRKDQRLNPIKTKADLPWYQVTMKNYFSIPNPMAFMNVTQEGSRVIKGSSVMIFFS